MLLWLPLLHLQLLCLWLWPHLQLWWCSNLHGPSSRGHHEGCCWPCHCAAAARTSVSDANYAMHPLQVSYLFQSWASHQFHYVGVCYGVCLLFSDSHDAAMLTSGAQSLGFTPPQPFIVCPWQAYVQLHLVHGLYQECTMWLLLPLLLVGGSFMLLTQLSTSQSINMDGHVALRAFQRVTHPSAFPTWWGGVFSSTWWHSQYWIYGGH